jgi:uncharacterized damage-inducible protein DinB
MIDSAYLSDLLRKAHADDPWHGPSVVDTLDGLTAEQAAAHPIPNAHSIWEIVLHLAAWQGEAARRLEGNAPDLPQEGDWPEPGEIAEESWQQARHRLETTLDHLREVLATRSNADLDHPGGSLSDRALGTGVPYRTMVVGALQHAAYHSGQIVMLRKALTER